MVDIRPGDGQLSGAAVSHPRAVVVDATDNVATLIDEAVVGDVCELTGAVSGELAAVEPIPYGHKVATQDIRRGDDVVKYAEAIGRATSDIPAGAHVHVQNVESLRGRGDLTSRA